MRGELNKLDEARRLLVAAPRGPNGETVEAMLALNTLDGQEAMITMGAFSKGLGVTMGAGTNAANKLVVDGLAERDRSTKDRRIVLIGITPKGLAALDAYVGQVVATMGGKA